MLHVYIPQYLKRILWLIFSCFIGITTIFTISFFIAWNSGELLPFAEIAIKQQKFNALYGPCLQSFYQPYRKALYALRKPDVLAIGSSRSGSFREEFFSKSFVNAAQAARDIDQTYQVLQELLKIHKPKMIILTLDFWWLNPNNTQIKPTYTDKEETIFTFAKAGFILDSFIRGKLGTKDVIRALSGNKKTPWNNQPCIGLQVLTTGTGARPDGSILYGESALKGMYQEGKFSLSLNLIKRGAGNYEHSTIVDREKLEKLCKIIDWVNSEQIMLIIIAPPVAPTIHKAMEHTQKYNFIKLFEEKLKYYPFFFCFHDPKSISTTDQEFSDGYHGGEITYARILKKILEMNNKFINEYLNEEQIDFSIKNFNNCILVKFPKDRYLVEEKPYSKATVREFIRSIL